MENTSRDRSLENVDPHDPSRTVEPLLRPKVGNSSHVPGGATELADTARALAEKAANEEAHQKKR